MISKFGFIGFGSIARKHRVILQEIVPDAKFAMLSSQQGSPETGDLFFPQIDDFLDWGPELIAITSPSAFHARYIERLVAQNVPIFIEKPLAASVKDASLIRDCAQALQAKVGVGYNLRFTAAFTMIKQTIHNGSIGQVSHVLSVVGQNLTEWRQGRAVAETASGSRLKGGGVLRELSHELDYLYALFGAPTKVMGMTGTQHFLDLDVEDTAHVHLRFDSGARPFFATVIMDFMRHDTTRSCSIVGTNATLEWNLIEGYVDCIEKGGHRRRLGEFEQDVVGSYKKLWSELLSGNWDQLATLDDGVTIMKIIEAVETDGNGRSGELSS